MPQLDVGSFFNQVFWFTILILFVYRLVSYSVIPQIVFGLSAQVRLNKIIEMWASSVTSNLTVHFIRSNSRVENRSFSNVLLLLYDLAYASVCLRSVSSNSTFFSFFNLFLYKYYGSLVCLSIKCFCIDFRL